MSIIRQMSESEDKKLDRRVIRTRALLRDALTALILEKGYDAVTVQDIVDRANLGRATFYLHYRDKEDLLITSLKETFDGLVSALDPEGISLDNDPRAIAFKHAAEHRDFYRVMLSGQGTGTILKQIRAYLAEVTEAYIRAVIAQMPNLSLTIPLDVLSQYLGGALLSLITWWLETDTGYTTETMALAFQKLSRQALIAALMPGDVPPGWEWLLKPLPGKETLDRRVHPG
ncbi:MAG TPA: TetR/AcrR family transcriptional regulator [Aggregatilineales bacterium]|nr:TetR/AcrR family transcriptional regulator [Aggregatilineales bacterium]